MQRLCVISFIFLGIFCGIPQNTIEAYTVPWWEIQSIDTMKYSRDTSGYYLEHPAVGLQVMQTQVEAIAQTGATHVGIATPYDERFIPILKMWVATARQHGLKVWFRGNWSGWEEWFEYPRITRQEHMKLTERFIIDNQDLFQDGDIFSPCPECENGGPGDPRFNDDAIGHQQFLISMYEMTQRTFKMIDKDVASHYESMNGDVARLIMDPATTLALGGVVTVDHYVPSAQQLATDITGFAQNSKGKVVLGEFGAPIPDLHGDMTEQQQAEWLDEALALLAKERRLVGLNYWTSVGGSTALWHEDGTPKQAVAVLTKYFSPQVVVARVVSAKEIPITQATILSQEKKVTTGKDGVFVLPYITTEGNAIIFAPGYTEVVMPFSQLLDAQEIVLEPTSTSFWQRVVTFFEIVAFWK